MSLRSCRPISVFSLLLPLCLAALSGCRSPQAPAAPAAKPDNTLAVVVQTTRIGDVTQTVEVTGSLVALQDVSLSAKQGGRLTEVNVREGDTVSAGQVLARVDATDLQSQVRADEAAVSSAQAKISQAQAAYKQQVATTTAAITSARAAYDQQVATSSAQVRSMQSALAAARSNLSTVQEGARPEERLQTQATLASAEANYKKAQADVNRYDKLHNAGAVSDAEMDQYRNTRDVALANLNSAKAALQLQQQGNRRQDVEQAQEKVRQAEESLRQAQAAKATDAVKKADLETAIAQKAQDSVKQADVQAAQAALLQAQNTLTIARKAVADTVVISPIAGRISARTAEPGQVVTSSTVLLHVITLDSVYFEPAVPDTLMARIRVGQSVAVHIDTYPGRAFPGTITRIYPQSAAASRAVSLRVTLPNTQGMLRPNMFAQGQIVTEKRQGVVLVPRTALVQGNLTSGSRKTTVFTVEDNVAHTHSVTTGLSADKGDWVEVTGLPAKATVIVLGQNDVKDGQKVVTTTATQTSDNTTTRQ